MKKLLALILTLLIVFQGSITAFAFKDSTKNIFTSKKYTHDDKFANYEIVNGLDISYHQSTVDFKKLKASGVDFLFLRAGYRGYGSSGSLNKDTKFNSFAQSAISAGIDIGVYFYSQAITVEEAKAEAEYTLNIIKGYDITMPVMFDFEYASGAKDGGRLAKAKLSNKAHTDICLAFCETVEKAGYTSGVYANHSMLLNDVNDEVIEKEYVIWLANYNTAPKYNDKFYDREYTYWQYSSSGKVNGIDGRVDCNFRYFKAPDKVLDLKIASETTIGTTLSWEKVKGCYGYEIYRYDADKKSYIKIGTNKGASVCEFTDANTNAISNSYKVKAISRNKGKFVAGKFSDEVKSNGIFKMTMQSNGTGYATFTWQIMPNTSEYQILRADTENGEYTYIATVNSKTTHYTDYTDDGFKTYYYMVRSLVRDENGLLVANTYTPCLKAEKQQPTMSNAILTANNAITISWVNVPYSSGVEIWRNKGNQGYKKLANVDSTVSSYTNMKLTRGVKYRYKVRQYIVKNGKTYYSSFSDEKYVTTLKTTTVTLSTSSKSAKIVYAKSEGANGYEIYMKAPKYKKYKKIATTTKLGFTKTKLKSGKAYKFRVRAYKVVNGKTIYSPYSKTKKIKIK